MTVLVADGLLSVLEPTLVRPLKVSISEDERCTVGAATRKSCVRVSLIMDTVFSLDAEFIRLKLKRMVGCVFKLPNTVFGYT